MKLNLAIVALLIAATTVWVLFFLMVNSRPLTAEPTNTSYVVYSQQFNQVQPAMTVSDIQPTKGVQ